MIDKRRYYFLKVINSFLNIPYRWGGDDPGVGFDCSGMVVEGLKSVGVIGLDDDYTANELWQKFKAKQLGKPDEGVLAFWFKDNGKASHVAICLDDEFCITADGGGRHILTYEDALKYNAFIKIRQISHRTNKPKFIDVFWK